jgi:hypothetical protein
MVVSTDPAHSLSDSFAQVVINVAQKNKYTMNHFFIGFLRFFFSSSVV